MINLYNTQKYIIWLKSETEVIGSVESLRTVNV